MPKLKSHRGAAKRFKKTATGKFMRGKAFKQHILTSKTTQPEARSQGHRRGVARQAGQAAEDAAGLTMTDEPEDRIDRGRDA